MKKNLTLILLTALFAIPCAAQQKDDNQGKPEQTQYQKEKSTIPYKVDRKTAKARRTATRKGNTELKKKYFSNAVNEYRNALKADSNYAKAQYNRGIAHSRLGQNDTALAYYRKLCQNTSATAAQRANAHYNSGNILLRNALAARDTGGYDGQSLRQAIEEYKASLRLDSQNGNAKHNLSLAKQLLRPEQQNGGGGQNQQNQNQNQDQNQQNQQNQQDKQDQQQNQQNQNQQNQQQQNQQQDQQQQPQNQQNKKQQEQRRREAEQMLNAMKNNEQQTMKAVRMREAEKERRQGTPARIEKDW